MNFFFTHHTSAERVYEEPQIFENPEPDRVWIIPFGGLGEIGKNMMVLESSRDIVIIDAGIMFPKEDMPGVDYVIPDIRYLFHKKDKIRGIILTHGHEDHIGAIPYIISHLQVPICGTRLTMEFIKYKLLEFELPSPTLINIKPGDSVELGDFAVHFFSVVHSISESMGLIIDTPAGSFMHSGDFKLESSEGAEIEMLQKICHSGIRLLMSDSTYAERPGFSIPEKEVGKALRKVFRNCAGRIIISTFASSIPRIQQILDIAEQHNRKLCIHGKGLETTLNIAQELGYLSIPGGLLVKREEARKIPDSELLILATGSQGEPLSALTLMATNNHKWVKIKRGDTVVISATPVPGNETLIHNTINSLFRLGANVIYDLPYKAVGKEEFHIHVSGHGSSEELKMLIKLARPQSFMPIHGEIRHLIHHTRLARDAGIEEKDIFMLLDGDILEISRSEGRILGKICIEDIMVDGLGIGDVGRSILKDRQLMAENGICFAVITVDEKTGELISGPHIETRGLIYVKESQNILEEARQEVLDSLPENSPTTEKLGIAIKSSLRKFFHARTKRRPIVVPMVIRI